MEGNDIIPTAMIHIGERYVLGARAPLANTRHKGPWDCAEFASWCAYQTYRIVFGCYGQNPKTADPYSGKWYEDAKAAGTTVSVQSALRSPGAFLVRRPGDFNIGIGHVAISLGDGRTVEARSASYGVTVSPRAASRSWTTGVQLPGVLYLDGEETDYEPPTRIFRIAHPYMRGPAIRSVQEELARRGFVVEIDGIFGLDTAAAVANFQLEAGVVVDGEIGPETAAALGLEWPIQAD